MGSGHRRRPGERPALAGAVGAGPREAGKAGNGGVVVSLRPHDVLDVGHGGPAERRERRIGIRHHRPDVGGGPEPDGYQRILPSGRAGLSWAGRPHRPGVVPGEHIRIGGQGGGDLGERAVDPPSRVTPRHPGRHLKPEAGEGDDQLDRTEPEHEPAALDHGSNEDRLLHGVTVAYLRSD